MHASPRSLSVTLAALFAAVLVLVGTPPAAAYPPTPPPASTSLANLDTMTVRAESGADSYDRDLFTHWVTVSGSCDAREEVLKRDGSGVSVDSSCQPSTGSWYSVYHQVWIEDSSDVDIDHVVPLSEAWASGADAWTEDMRDEFANDLAAPQLIAVSASSNRSKGDQDPAEWLPTSTANHCMYARNWVEVKYTYELSVDSAEKSALVTILEGC